MAHAGLPVLELEAEQRMHKLVGDNGSPEDRVNRAGYSYRGQLEALAHVHSLVEQDDHHRSEASTVLCHYILLVHVHWGRKAQELVRSLASVAEWEARTQGMLVRIAEALRMEPAEVVDIALSGRRTAGRSLGDSLRQTGAAVHVDGDAAGHVHDQQAIAEVPVDNQQPVAENQGSALAADEPDTVVVQHSRTELEVIRDSPRVLRIDRHDHVHDAVPHHESYRAEDMGRLGDHNLQD